LKIPALLLVEIVTLMSFIQQLDSHSLQKGLWDLVCCYEYGKGYERLAMQTMLQKIYGTLQQILRIQDFKQAIQGSCGPPL